MTSTNKRTRTIRSILLLLIAVAVGVGLAQFLPSDLFGLHAGQGQAERQDSVAKSDKQLWTCGMHPHVIEEEPGQCPICGMNLVPMRGGQGDHTGHDHADGEPTAANGSGERTVLFYRNPMDPAITSPVPAKDSMGMDYVPVYADAAGAASDSKGTIRIDPLVEQNMNVRTELVERRDLTQPIRTVGYLEFDQQRMVTVTTKYSGWVEKVYVNYVGEEVRRGQPLFEVYSPELVQTEQELLSALKFARELKEAPDDALERAESLVESARTRLGYWDISKRQIAQLEETGEVFRTLKVAAPSNGLVMKRMAGLEGMAIKPGMEIFHIADLTSLWISAELFEDHIAWIHEGTPARIELSYFPGEFFHGKVRFLEPELSEKTRTMRAMIELPNPGGRLRKGMYATVEFQPVVVRDAVAVPTEAVLRTGQRNVVVEALGEGRFAPREVTLGHEAEGYVQILDGLGAGVEVVTSAQFLLDSESKLREAIQKMVAQRSSEAPPEMEMPASSTSSSTTTELAGDDSHTGDS